MTIGEARELLSKPLKFGSESQLAAVRLLRAVREAREKIERCKHCEGEGLNRRGKLCPWCAADYSTEVLLAVGVGEET